VGGVGVAVSQGAAATIRRWRERPDLMVVELFGVVPDAWQGKVLRAFPETPRVALLASRGPGKTATLAWLAWNVLLCYEHPKVAAVSISRDNLADNLWTEMSKWQAKSALLREKFT